MEKLFLLLILYIIPFLLYFIYVIMKTIKSVHMFQQNWYNDGNRYIKWLFSNFKKTFINLELLSLMFIVYKLIDERYFIYTSTMKNILFISFLIINLLCLLVFIRNKKFEQVKLKLNYTKRVKRLLLTISVFYLISYLLLFKFIYSTHPYLFFILLFLNSYFNSFIIILSNILNRPIEKLINLYYKNKAKNKLKNSLVDVIGITGSYGKTSSKNILNDILSVKFDTCPTPKNYNTPAGLMLTINNYLDKFSNILIAEMGAFKNGEIKELCDFVHPKYGILTRIGTAHLESFGSQENIQKTKFELIESLPSDGCGILNIDDPLQVSYKLKNDCNIIWIGIDNTKADIYATNIKMDYNGMNFDVIFKGDKTKYHFETVLLGRPNIYNILAAIGLGSYLGITKEQLMIGVKKVKPIEHRLELKKYLDINILDDAYNSNPIGSKMALDVLNLMPGKKIIVTPGMIELGSMQEKLNSEFGEYIASVCDEVILVGEVQTKPIYNGLMNKKYDKNKIHIINDVKLAFSLMQELKSNSTSTYVLLENDLPDIFNE